MSTILRPPFNLIGRPVHPGSSKAAHEWTQRCKRGRWDSVTHQLWCCQQQNVAHSRLPQGSLSGSIQGGGRSKIQRKTKHGNLEKKTFPARALGRQGRGPSHHVKEPHSKTSSSRAIGSAPASACGDELSICSVGMHCSSRLMRRPRGNTSGAAVIESLTGTRGKFQRKTPPTHPQSPRGATQG